MRTNIPQQSSSRRQRKQSTKKANLKQPQQWIQPVSHTLWNKILKLISIHNFDLKFTKFINYYFDFIVIISFQLKIIAQNNAIQTTNLLDQAMKKHMLVTNHSRIWTTIPTSWIKTIRNIRITKHKNSLYHKMSPCFNNHGKYIMRHRKYTLCIFTTFLSFQ